MIMQSTPYTTIGLWLNLSLLRLITPYYGWLSFTTNQWSYCKLCPSTGNVKSILQVPLRNDLKTCTSNCSTFIPSMHVISSCLVVSLLYFHYVTWTLETISHYIGLSFTLEVFKIHHLFSINCIAWPMIVPSLWTFIHYFFMMKKCFYFL